MGAISASAVLKLSNPDSPLSASAVEQPSTPTLGSEEAVNHFTSYTKEKYPDLTYAAENAVGAVVNIEVLTRVQGSNSFDPFLQFFGIPQGYGAPSTREAKTGGSGVLITSDGYIVTNNHVEGETLRRPLVRRKGCGHRPHHRRCATED